MKKFILNKNLLNYKIKKGENNYDINNNQWKNINNFRKRVWK